jgi:hypothetical protein
MVGTWIACVAYVGSRINRDWTPHDEGLLAQTAARTLAGQLPHRDFGDAYTGLLTAYHAMAFAVGGQSLLTLRCALLLAFALWVPAFYVIAVRFLSPWAAALATATAVAWSVPNYSASMPSWYNLFLATAGTLAVVWYLETRSRRWLAVAGLCAGLSVLVKIVGIYFIVAVVAFLYWRGLDSSNELPDAMVSSRRRELRVAFAIVAAIMLPLGLLGLVWHGIAAGTVLHFVVPGVAVSLIIVAAGLRSRAVRWRTVSLELLAFAAGVGAPIIVFLVPFVANHAGRALITGVFVLPLRRLVSATLTAPGFREGARASAIAVGLCVAAFARGPTRRIITAVAIPVALGVLLLSSHGRVYVNIFDAARVTVPIVACAAAALLLFKHGLVRPSIARERAVLVVFVAIFFSLVQFPFAAAVYFCYVAPLALLSVIAVTTELSPRVPSGVGGILLAFALCFAVGRMNTRAYYTLGTVVPQPKATATLPLPRGGLRIGRSDSVVFTRLVTTLRAHATGGYTFCTPDCPEAYFLAGLRNPTRTTFEFLNDPPGDTWNVLRSIDQHSITVVAVNRQFRFSSVDTSLVLALRRQFPDSTRVGYFTVRWR